MYAAYDSENVIWGVGETESAAITDGIDWIILSGDDVDVNLNVEKCTDDLAAEVVSRGGQVRWEWSGNPNRRVMQVS